MSSEITRRAAGPIELNFNPGDRRSCEISCRSLTFGRSCCGTKVGARICSPLHRHRPKVSRWWAACGHRDQV